MKIRLQTFPARLALAAALLAFLSPVRAQTVIWNDAGADMTWTQPDAANWSGATYASGDICQFTNTGAGLITISGTVTPGAVTVSGISNYVFTGGSIGGPGTFTVSGSNVVTFLNTNTYAGLTEVTSNGVLNVGTISNNSPSLSNGLLLGDATAADSAFGILEGNGTFTCALGSNATPGPNQVSGASGGFAALGGTFTVNLGGAGATIALSQGAFNFGKNLVFGANNANSQVILVNPVNINSAAEHVITVTHGAGGDSALMQGPISDSVTPTGTILELLGAGTLILTATNTYAGATLLETGTLQLGNGGATGSLNPNGTIQANLNGLLTISRTNTITQGIDFSSSPITGAGSVQLVTNGILVLTTNNVYTGLTVARGGGVLQAGALGSSGNVFTNSSGLLLGDTNSASGIIGILEGYGTFTRALGSSKTPGSNQVSCAAGGFAALGGTLTVNLGGAGATVALNQGAFNFGNNWCFGCSNANNQVIVVNPIYFNNGASSGAHRIFTVFSGVGGDSVNLAGPITDSGNPYGLYKDGPGLMILSATNTYSLDTWCENGTIQLTGELSPNATLTLGQTNVCGLFILGGPGGPVDQTVAGLKSSGTGATNAVVGGNAAVSTLTVDPNGNNYTFTGNLGGSGPNQNNLALVVSGFGTETLAGTNSYAGGTTVAGGTLEIVQPTLNAGSTVTVADGAVLQLDFAVTNTVAGLVLNGVSQPSGVYNSTTGAPYLTGAGSLLVSPAPVFATNPTNITFSVSGNTLNLSWPADHLGWLVQSNSLDLSNPNDWFDISNTASGTGSSFTIAPTQPNVFYRLREP